MFEACTREFQHSHVHEVLMLSTAGKT